MSYLALTFFVEYSQRHFAAERGDTGIVGLHIALRKMRKQAPIATHLMKRGAS